MFVVFNHYPKWNWDSLPKELTESVHMTLDNPSCTDNGRFDDPDSGIPEHMERSETIPVHTIHQELSSL